MKCNTLHEKYSNYRYCVVRECKNTSIKTPGKLWIRVPSEMNTRNTWLNIAGRDPATLLSAQIYFCEDHFDLPNDMENYMRYRVMGTVSQVRMKPGCIPTKFECQQDKRKRKRPTIHKKKRKLLIENLEELRALECGGASSRSSVLHQDSDEDIKQAQKSIDKYVQVNIRTKFRSKAIQVNMKSREGVAANNSRSKRRAVGAWTTSCCPEEESGETPTATATAAEERVWCSRCSEPIGRHAALFRCVQCAGAALCCRCVCRAPDAHREHCVMRLPSARVYCILEGLFDQLRLDVRDLIEKDSQDSTTKIQDSSYDQDITVQTIKEQDDEFGIKQEPREIEITMVIKQELTEEDTADESGLDPPSMSQLAPPQNKRGFKTLNQTLPVTFDRKLTKTPQLLPEERKRKADPVKTETSTRAKRLTTERDAGAGSFSKAMVTYGGATVTHDDSTVTHGDATMQSDAVNINKQGEVAETHQVFIKQEVMDDAEQHFTYHVDSNVNE